MAIAPRFISWVYFNGSITPLGIQQVLNRIIQGANDVFNYIQLNINGGGGGVCTPDVLWKNEVDAIVAAIPTLIPDIILTTTGAGDLQTAINNLASSGGGVLQVNTNAVYSPVTIPYCTGSMTIKVGIGFVPEISGANAIMVLNNSPNVHDVTMSGFTLPNCSTADSNALGAGICIQHLATPSRIIFANMIVNNVVSGSGVMWSYHQSISGDDYQNYYLYPTAFTDRLAFVNCNFFHGGVEGTEGGNITLRAVDLAYIKNCTINGDNIVAGSRGIQLLDCLRFLCEDCECYGFPSGGNNEAFKSRFFGIYGATVPTYRISGTFRNCKAHNANRGFRISYQSNVYCVKCEAHDCAEYNYKIDGGPAVPPATFAVACFECCKGYDGPIGVWASYTGYAVCGKYFLRWNQMYNNPTGSGGSNNQNYKLEDGGPLDPSNTEYPAS